MVMSSLGINDKLRCVIVIKQYIIHSPILTKPAGLCLVRRQLWRV